MRKFLRKIKGIKNHFTLDHLKNIHNFLAEVKQRNSPEYYDEYKDQIVECLRDLSEILIYGDRNETGFFDYFLESQMFSLIISFIDGHNVVQIKTQLIQTVFILLDNLHDHGAVYYLLSNDHINHIITHPGLDLSESIDLLSNYITFLKTLALKMDSVLINFFYNQSAPLGCRLPIFTEAAGLFNNREQMVRIGVRVVVLSLFKTATGPIRDYMLHYAVCPYFANLVWFVRKQVKALSDKVVAAAEGECVSANVYMDEIEDVFNHFQDIYNINDNELSGALTHYCLFCFIIPQLLESLTPSVPSDTVHPSVTFAVLNLLFKTVKHVPLLNSVLESLLSPSPHLALTHPSLVAGMEVNVPPPTIKEALAAITAHASFDRKTQLNEIKSIDKVSFPAEKGEQAGLADSSSHEQRDKKNPFLDAVLSMLSKTSERCFYESINSNATSTEVTKGIVRKSSTLNKGDINDSQQSNTYWTDEEEECEGYTEDSSQDESDADSHQDDEKQREIDDNISPCDLKCTKDKAKGTKSNLDNHTDSQSQKEGHSAATPTKAGQQTQERDFATIKTKSIHSSQNMTFFEKAANEQDQRAPEEKPAQKDIPVVVSTNTSESAIPKDVNIVIEDEAMLLRSTTREERQPTQYPINENVYLALFGLFTTVLKAKVLPNAILKECKIMPPLYERSKSAYKFLTDEISEKEPSQKDRNISDEFRAENTHESEFLWKLSESLKAFLLHPSFEVSTVQLAIDLFVIIMKLLEKDYFKNEDNMIHNAIKVISELLYDDVQKNKATMEVFDEEYESFKKTNENSASFEKVMEHLLTPKQSKRHDKLRKRIDHFLALRSASFSVLGEKDKFLPLKTIDIGKKLAGIGECFEFSNSSVYFYFIDVKTDQKCLVVIRGEHIFVVSIAPTFLKNFVAANQTQQKLLRTSSERFRKLLDNDEEMVKKRSDALNSFFSFKKAPPTSKSEAQLKRTNTTISSTTLQSNTEPPPFVGIIQGSSVNQIQISTLQRCKVMTILPLLKTKFTLNSPTCLTLSSDGNSVTLESKSELTIQTLLLYNEEMSKKARAFKAGQLEIILRDGASLNEDTTNSSTDDDTSDSTDNSCDAECDPLS